MAWCVSPSSCSFSPASSLLLHAVCIAMCSGSHWSHNVFEERCWLGLGCQGPYLSPGTQPLALAGPWACFFPPLHSPGRLTAFASDEFFRHIHYGAVLRIEMLVFQEWHRAFVLVALLVPPQSSPGSKQDHSSQQGAAGGKLAMWGLWCLGKCVDGERKCACKHPFLEISVWKKKWVTQSV